jgi:uncharacterized protein
MEFDTFTVVILEGRTDAAPLAPPEAAKLQDAHMAYLAGLHDADLLQAAGPFVSPPGRAFRGICLHRRPVEEVRRLFEMDPAVRAGQLGFRLFEWMVPKGAIQFRPVPFPRSMEEA